MDEPAKTHAAFGRPRSVLLAVALAVVVSALDQGIKAYVESTMRVGESIYLLSDFLSITYIRNDGAAFGLLAGRGALLLAGSAAAVGVVVWMLFSGEPSRLVSCGCGLVLGGAAGNLLDRLGSGYVTDYIYFNFWYIFNAADVAIVTGAGLLVLSSLRPPRRAERT